MERTAPLPFPELEAKQLSLHEKVLLKAIAEGYQTGAFAGAFDNKSISYKLNSAGSRVHDSDISGVNIEQLVKAFKKDPKVAAAICRNNLLAIMRDPQEKNLEEKRGRLSRYYDAYVSLTVKLDKAAFPPQSPLSEAQSGVPTYIPDGLSDMGSDKQVNPALRTREKIRVNKKEVLTESKAFFLELLEELGLNPELQADGDPAKLEKLKIQIVKKIANYLYKRVKYNHAQTIPAAAQVRSVGIVEFFDSGVCRHIAMLAQILYQFMGITSRVFKNDMNDEPHVSNFLRLNGEWNIIDVTNPIYKNPDDDTFIFGGMKIQNPDSVPNGHEWEFTFINKEQQEFKRRYRLRQNMYYRILDNSVT
ncbi:MAG TPA: transglutaminase domain-containing protein [Vitreimonas sp.]|nr:transglutaminase domain-containing protein [Vitreimonas sp.]